MKDDIWKRDEVESPCINICVVHPDARICVGCKRSMDEITNWSHMTPDMRAAIMADLPLRVPILTRRKGGRAARLKS